VARTQARRGDLLEGKKQAGLSVSKEENK